MSVFKYRLYCNTEGDYVTGLGETAPTVCYNNNTHSIDANSITIIGEISDVMVKVQEETIETGGNYKSFTKKINVSAGPDVDSELSFSIDWPVSLLSTSMVTTNSHEGDILNVYIAPDEPIGTIISDISIGVNVIDVSQSVIENIKLGYKIKLFDGVSVFNDLGGVIAIDEQNNQITTQNNTTDAFTTSPATIVLMTIHMIEDWEIGSAWHYAIGHDKIGGSYLPKTRNIKIVYTNKSGDTKKLVVGINCLY